MSGWNARKRQILTFLEVVEEATARAVADACDIEIHNARTLLARYHRYGLLSRSTRDRSGTRVYAITTKGLDRLTWLQDMDEDLAQEREPRSKGYPEALHRQDEQRPPRQVTATQLRERVRREEERFRREEERLRVLEAELMGWNTGNWTEYLRLRLRSQPASSTEDS
jgi:predicted transcriptional regulator